MKRVTVWIVGWTMGAGLLAGALAVPVRAAEKIRITVPVHSTTFAPLYHARAAGYFAEEGLDVDVVVVPGAGSLQAVLSRDAQFAMARASSGGSARSNR